MKGSLKYLEAAVVGFALLVEGGSCTTTATG